MFLLLNTVSIYLLLLLFGNHCFGQVLPLCIVEGEMQQIACFCSTNGAELCSPDRGEL
jgi:hypothetical protein